jgi:hypothetical protein
MKRTSALTVRGVIPLNQQPRRASSICPLRFAILNRSASFCRRGPLKRFENCGDSINIARNPTIIMLAHRLRSRLERWLCLRDSQPNVDGVESSRRSTTRATIPVCAEPSCQIARSRTAGKLSFQLRRARAVSPVKPRLGGPWNAQGAPVASSRLEAERVPSAARLLVSGHRFVVLPGVESGQQGRPCLRGHPGCIPPG